MALRQPLYWDAGSGSIKTMTQAHIDNIVSHAIYQYSLSPSVTLSVVASGGDLGTISDTRKSAGAYLTRVDRYPTEAETAEPGTVTVNFSRIDQAVATVSQPTAGAEGSYPVYYYNGGLRPMSETDVYDTFISPAIDSLTSGSLTSSGQGGTYRIHTTTSLAGHTLVSAGAVFIDTRADTSVYTAGGIPETLDQPTTIQSFYLHRLDGTTPSAYIKPLRVTASGNNSQIFSNALFDTLLQNHVRYAAASATGLNIRYSYSTGNNRGSGMSNTILNGSGAYTIRFVNSNDYRAQEFPNGTAITASTTYLKIRKA